MTRDSVRLSCATTTTLSAFLNLNGGPKNIKHFSTVQGILVQPFDRYHFIAVFWMMKYIFNDQIETNKLSWLLNRPTWVVFFGGGRKILGFFLPRFNPILGQKSHSNRNESFNFHPAPNSRFLYNGCRKITFWALREHFLRHLKIFCSLFSSKLDWNSKFNLIQIFLMHYFLKYLLFIYYFT